MIVACDAVQRLQIIVCSAAETDKNNDQGQKALGGESEREMVSVIHEILFFTYLFLLIYFFIFYVN